MKIIFLDFDGCLNSAEYFGGGRYDPPSEVDSIHYENDLDPQAINCINYIVKQTSAKIVIISSCKYYCSLQEIKLFLANRCFIGKILDMAPQNAGDSKEDDIWNWIDQNKNIDIESILIIEDWPEIKDFKEYWIQPDPDFGFCEDDINLALEILNKNFY